MQPGTPGLPDEMLKLDPGSVIAPPAAPGRERAPAGNVEVRPRQRLRPGVVLERRRIAFRLVALAQLEADLDGVRIEPQRVVTNAAAAHDRLALCQKGTTLRPIPHHERQGA